MTIKRVPGHTTACARFNDFLRPEFRDQARDAMHAPLWISTGCAKSSSTFPSTMVPRGLAFNPSEWPEDWFEGSDRITFTEPY